MKHWVALMSPWADEFDRWYVGLLDVCLRPGLRWQKDSGPDRVLGASSDGSGAALSADEARLVAKALNTLLPVGGT